MRGQEKVVLLLSIIAVPCLIWYSNEVKTFMQLRQSVYPDVVFARMFDFVYAILTAAGILVVRKILAETITKDLSNKLILKQQGWDDVQLIGRREKFQHCIFLVVYYVAATLLGWWVLVDKPWVPGIIIPGASGDVANCWKNFWTQYNDDFGVRMYYMVSLGYAFQSLVYLIIRKHRRDFLEMALHHALEIALITYSFIYGYIRIGTLVLMVHDVGDIAVNTSRCLNDASFKKPAIISFICLIVSWIWFRLYLFPAYIIHSTMFDAYHYISEGATSVVHNEGYWFFNIMLILLFVLHIFWFAMFMKMGFNILFKNKCEDEINDVINDTDEVSGTPVDKKGN